MHMTYITYVALLHKAKKKTASYGIIFPDFPGCVFAGKTMDQALKNAREGLIFHIEGIQSAGEPVPKPTSLEEIRKNPKNRIAIPALVKIIIPTGQIKRLNISMDTGLLVEIDQAAKTTGRNRSEFLADAARAVLS
jgi:predicted RNase H-like HicB family nuclease